MRKTKTNHRAAPKNPPAIPEENAPEPTTQETAEAPDWVNETPNDTEYNLTMFDGDGGYTQDIDLTRREFTTLKRWLAALRGYDLRTPLNQYHTECLKNKTEEQRLAATLEITQEEIQMVIDFERVGDELCLNFRRRLKLGAEVEQGKWHLDEEAAGSVESYEGEVGGTGRCGLDIHLVAPETKTGAEPA